MTTHDQCSQDVVLERRRLTREHIDWLEELLARGLTVRIRATGESMRPFIRSGSRISFRRFAGPIRTGDVVLILEHGHRPLIHRVYRVEERSGTLWIQTHGDSAHRPDAFVPRASIVGRVVRVQEPRTTEWLATAVALRLGRIGAPLALTRRRMSRLGARARAVWTGNPRVVK